VEARAHDDDDNNEYDHNNTEQTGCRLLCFRSLSYLLFTQLNFNCKRESSHILQESHERSEIQSQQKTGPHETLQPQQLSTIYCEEYDIT
jgi:hypothetical protein